MSRVTLKPGSLALDINRSSIVAELTQDLAGPEPYQNEATITIFCPISPRRRDAELRMVVSNSAQPHREPNPTLIQLVLLAHRCLAILHDSQGKTLSDVAVSEGVDLADVSRTLPLAFLAPAIVDCILDGTQPVTLTTQRLSPLADLPSS